MSPRRRASEAGFTLVEVLIAMTLMLVAIGGILTVFDGSTSTTVAQQRDTQAVSVGEREIERARTLVKQYGFASLALSSAPVGVVSPTTDPSEPNAFVSGSSLVVRESWHDTASTLLASEPLVVATSTAGNADRLAPGPESFSIAPSSDTGPATVTVNRYVSRRSDPSCPVGTPSCQNDSRRVVVAVRIARNGQDVARTKPVWFSTIINSGVPSNTAAGSGGLSLGVNLP